MKWHRKVEQRITLGEEIDSQLLGNYLSNKIVEDIMPIVKAGGFAHRQAVIELGGPDGNAYVLLGIANAMLKKKGIDPDLYIKIMKASDYGHLVRTFNELLGEHFTIVLPEGVNSLEDL